MNEIRIVVWKLGNLEHKIIPSKEAIETLAGIISQWDGKENLHVVWGPDLEVQVVSVLPGDIHVVYDVDGAKSVTVVK